jgi:hypothetical protein
MARSAANLPGCGLFSWLNLLTCVLVIMKLGGAIDLSWLAVTMPTWGPYVLIFVLGWLFSVLGGGGQVRRTRTRRRTRSRRRSRIPFL